MAAVAPQALVAFRSQRATGWSDRPANSALRPQPAASAFVAALPKRLRSTPACLLSGNEP